MCAWNKGSSKDTERSITKRRYCDRFQNLPISILSEVQYVSFGEDHLILSEIVGFMASQVDTDASHINVRSWCLGFLCASTCVCYGDGGLST